MSETEENALSNGRLVFFRAKEAAPRRRWSFWHPHGRVAPLLRRITRTLCAQRGATVLTPRSVSNRLPLLSPDLHQSFVMLHADHASPREQFIVRDSEWSDVALAAVPHTEYPVGTSQVAGPTRMPSAPQSALLTADQWLMDERLTEVASDVYRWNETHVVVTPRSVILCVPLLRGRRTCGVMVHSQKAPACPSEGETWLLPALDAFGFLTLADDRTTLSYHAERLHCLGGATQALFETRLLRTIFPGACFALMENGRAYSLTHAHGPETDDALVHIAALQQPLALFDLTHRDVAPRLCQRLQDGSFGATRYRIGPSFFTTSAASTADQPAKRVACCADGRSVTVRFIQLQRSGDLSQSRFAMVWVFHSANDTRSHMLKLLSTRT